MRFRVVCLDGRPFIQEQEAALSVGNTFFHPPEEPGTHGFFKVTAVESSNEAGIDAVVRVERLDQ